MYGPKGESPNNSFELSDDDTPEPGQGANGDSRGASRSPLKIGRPKKPGPDGDDGGMSIDVAELEDDPFAYPFEGNGSTFDFDQPNYLSGGEQTMGGEHAGGASYQNDFFGIDSQHQQPTADTKPPKSHGQEEEGGVLGKRKHELELKLA
jgi:hypothetical protein